LKFLEGKLDDIAAGREAPLSRRDLTDILESGPGIDGPLFRAASAVLGRNSGPGVYLRGIIEISNACQKNCFYCGLRRDNPGVARYRMNSREVMEALTHGWNAGLRSFLLQSGERLGGDFIEEVCAILAECRSRWGDSVRMVLSLGELPADVLDRLREAGGSRYLLRIETSDRGLYDRVHPCDGIHDWSARDACLRHLRATGWQTGSGVLIGFPWQTASVLAGDLEYLVDLDIDMCGMGPWIEHKDTPLDKVREQAPPRARRVSLTLRMIALLRILMPDINISATTALQTLDEEGLEKGLEAGGNVFMPNLTPPGYRADYNLYEGKTAVADDLESMITEGRKRCESVRRLLVLGDPGDPLHYGRRLATEGWMSGGAAPGDAIGGRG
jgi:biotin synthase